MSFDAISEGRDQFFNLFFKFISQVITILLNFSQTTTQTNHLTICISNQTSDTLVDLNWVTFWKSQQKWVISDERLSVLEVIIDLYGVFQEGDVLLDGEGVESN